MFAIIKLISQKCTGKNSWKDASGQTFRISNSGEKLKCSKFDAKK